MKAVFFKRPTFWLSSATGFAAVSWAHSEHQRPCDHVNTFDRYEIPVDKLTCHRHVGETSSAGQRENAQPVVLVACGSFNPPTCAHLRVLDVVREEYMRRGYDVYGAYLSPVHNSYGKESLVRGNHRLAMCRMAADSSDFVMVDPWEFSQETYTRTLYVLDSVDQRLSKILDPSNEQRSSGEDTAPSKSKEWEAKSVLVCGSDLVESMCDERVWDQHLLEELLSKHGVACVVRPGSDLHSVLEREGTLPHKYKDNIMIVQNNELGDVSSTIVRDRIRQGKSICGLVPVAVEDYVKKHQLYR